MVKPLGYAAGQFGKNHRGDRDEFLPTSKEIIGRSSAENGSTQYCA
jgi:arylsulfatase A-like enzyme